MPMGYVEADSPVHKFIYKDAVNFNRFGGGIFRRMAAPPPIGPSDARMVPRRLMAVKSTAFSYLPWHVREDHVAVHAPTLCGQGSQKALPPGSSAADRLGCGSA